MGFQSSIIGFLLTYHSSGPLEARGSVVMRPYTVTRIDGKFHQPHRMAPDQTIRVMESNFDICDGQIRFFPAFLMEIFDRFEVFRLYSLSKGWKSSTFRNFPIIFPFQRMECFDLHIDKLIWLRSNKKRLVYGKKRWRVIRFEYHFTMHLQYYRSLMFTETTKGQGRDNNIFHIILHFVIFFLLMYSLSSSWRIEVKIGFYVCLTGKSCWVK